MEPTNTRLNATRKQFLDGQARAHLAAEVRIAVGGHDLKDTVTQRKNRHIKGAAPKIVDHHAAIRGLLVQAVCQRGGGRLVNDPQHVQPGDAPRILRGLWRRG